MTPAHPAGAGAFRSEINNELTELLVAEPAPRTAEELERELRGLRSALREFATEMDFSRLSKRSLARRLREILDQPR
jgi:hypothetical protein